MHTLQAITDDLYYLGGSDRRLALFESVYPLPRGVSYNSYLLSDETTGQTATMSVTAQTLKENHAPLSSARGPQARSNAETTARDTTFQAAPSQPHAMETRLTRAKSATASTSTTRHALPWSARDPRARSSANQTAPDMKQPHARNPRPAAMAKSIPARLATAQMSAAEHVHSSSAKALSAHQDAAATAVLMTSPDAAPPNTAETASSTPLWAKSATAQI